MAHMLKYMIAYKITIIYNKILFYRLWKKSHRHSAKNNGSFDKTHDLVAARF